MDYAQQQRNPTKHMVGIGGVILLHLGIAYALMNGLGQKIVRVIQEPLETKIIEEVQPPPEPEQIPLPPPDLKVPPPPPSFVPPPEVQVNAPPPPNAIATVSAEKPPEAPFTPAPPPVKDAPPAPPAPLTAAVACSNFAEIREVMTERFPVVADKEDFAGKGIQSFEMNMVFTLGPSGEIKGIALSSSTNAFAARAMDSVVRNGIRRLKCAGQGRDLQVLVPIAFKLVD